MLLLLSSMLSFRPQFNNYRDIWLLSFEQLMSFSLFSLVFLYNGLYFESTINVVLLVIVFNIKFHVDVFNLVCEAIYVQK